MNAWAGMERFLHLSLGSQVGASGVALIAVLELKRILQYPADQDQLEASAYIVRLTAEEWRTVAGIHERKTFERAKAKLEKLEVLRIERNGRLLEITLWPDSIIAEEENAQCDRDVAVACASGEVNTELIRKPASELWCTEESSQAKLMTEVENDLRKGLVMRRVRSRKVRRLRLRLVESVAESSRVPYGTCSETGIDMDLETDNATRLGTRCRTEFGTSYGTSYGTELGTCRGTGRETSHGTCLATLCETGTVSQSERALRFKEDVVFLKPDVPENVISVRDNGLLRYPLSRYPLSRQYININNANNESTINEQRYNERRDVNQVTTPNSEEVLVEFAIRWVQEVGHPLTRYEKEGLVRFLRLGYTAELFVEALRCAVAADNRRMGYVLGILRNWYQEGVRCLEDVPEIKRHWEDQRFLKRVKIG